MNYWTWLRAKDHIGTRATIITELAAEEDIEDFNDRFGGSIEVYRRPIGLHWDGGTLGPSEVDRLKTSPYVRY